MLARKIAEYLDIPFAICDATGLTEAGYVGDDVESVLTRLINVADGDIEKAQRGIIYIDEIDKLARKGESMSITRDVSGEGVQQALLKMVEGSICRVPAGDKRKHPKGDMLEIDTRGILFICGGAFVGIDKIIQRRRGSKGVGFGATIKTKEEENLDVFKHHTTKDLISYGMIPEFVGRFGITVSVEKLTEAQLVQILKEPKNSLIKQYQYIFELDEIGLTFDDAALGAIAHKATELDTNARGLKSILEKILLPYQFDAVDLRERGLTNINITLDAVNQNPAELTFEKVKNEKTK
jgi:ATP-dependent Clp protease ATP-binding subunit ClpX